MKYEIYMNESVNTYKYACWVHLCPTAIVQILAPVCALVCVVSVATTASSRSFTVTEQYIHVDWVCVVSVATTASSRSCTITEQYVHVDATVMDYFANSTLYLSYCNRCGYLFLLCIYGFP